MFTVDVKVTPIVKEFLVSKYGSDTITLGKDDYFTQKIRHIIQRKPDAYKPIKPEDRGNYIRMQVKDVNFSIKSKSFACHHAEHSFLTDYLQLALSKELTKYFKEVFHSYVLAFCIAKNCVDGVQRDAIYSFADVFCLPMNKIDFDMLRKSWMRSNERRVLKKLQSKKCFLVSENLWYDKKK